jgi:hypothetical protein
MVNGQYTLLQFTIHESSRHFTINITLVAATENNLSSYDRLGSHIRNGACCSQKRLSDWSFLFLEKTLISFQQPVTDKNNNTVGAHYE